MFGKELLLCGSNPYPGYTRALLTVGEDHYSHVDETEYGRYYYNTDGYGFTTTGYHSELENFGTLTPSLGYVQLFAVYESVPDFRYKYFFCDPSFLFKWNAVSDVTQQRHCFLFTIPLFFIKGTNHRSLLKERIAFPCTSTQGVQYV